MLILLGPSWVTLGKFPSSEPQCLLHKGGGGQGLGSLLRSCKGLKGAIVPGAV